MKFRGRLSACISSAVILFAAACGVKPRYAAPAAAYVNPDLCAGCHAEIAKSYRRTGMGRSFARPSPANTFPAGAIDPVYFHAPSKSFFTMVQRDGKYFQRRHQTGFDGKAANVLEREIHYVVGSGAQVRTYLHRAPDNRLIELPLSWYAENGGRWLMSPGFDRPGHPGFRRAVTAECIFCHNAYPAVLPNRRGEEPVFPEALPQGIDCQRCHGPGSEHVRTAQQPGAKPVDIRSRIVNPAKLTPERQLEVCMQCHLETTSSRLPDSIVRFGRGPFSYVPGEPLDAFKLYFDHAPQSGRDGKFEIVSAAYRLRRSACFQRSGGKLLCTTCHNPHTGKPPRELGTVCRDCHATVLDRISTHPAGQDCASCHMPRRRSEDVVHAVITDHFIARHSPRGNLLAPLAERHETSGEAYRGEVVPYYPRPFPATPDHQLHLAAAQVMQQSNLEAGIGKLADAIHQHNPANAEFYLLLADAHRQAGQLDRALPQYQEALKRDATLTAARLQFGSALRLAKQTDRAAEVLQAAVQSAPDRAWGWYELGLVRVDQGNPTEAVRAFERAIAEDPDLAEAHNVLGGVLLGMGDAGRAESAVREAIRIWPEYADAHKNLGALLAAAGDIKQAGDHFETALRLQPGLTQARYHYAVALARMSRFDAAQKHIENVLREDPGHAEAHQILGALLAGRGQREPAIAEYRTALRIKPDFGRALVGLAQVLASRGDRNETITLLERAAVLPDPAIREQARTMLLQIRGR
jgi:tetratricopeptide (TPR) repeat protein